MLIGLWSYSQETYPKLILSGSDTLCVLTIPQVKKLNIAFVNLEFNKSLADTFRIMNKRLDFLVNKQVQLISNYENQLLLKSKAIDSMGEVNSMYKDLDIKNTRKIKFLRLQRNVLAVGVAVAILKIFVFK